MTDLASMLVSLFVGGLIGRWGTLAVEKERLVFERRVDVVSRFLWKASEYLAEHVASELEDPAAVREQKGELFRLSYQARLLLPDQLDDRIGEWVGRYARALDAIGSDRPTHPQAVKLVEELTEDLKALRAGLKRHISGSWLVVRLREARDRVRRSGDTGETS